MKFEFEKLGWPIAAGLVAIMAASGFQGSNLKVGVVDLQAVYHDSDQFKKGQDSLRAFQAARQDVLTFADQNPVFTPEQAQRFRELSLKETLTAAEKTELEKIKGDVKTAADQFTKLQTKPNPTQQDTTLLQDYNNRANTMRNVLQRWAQEMQDEMDKKLDDMQADTETQTRAAVAKVGKEQGYTIVYSKQVVPYAANDVTAEATKAMSKK